MKPSAPLGPGRSSEEEVDAAEAALDLRAGMAGRGRFAEIYFFYYILGIMSFLSWNVSVTHQSNIHSIQILF